MLRFHPMRSKSTPVLVVSDLGQSETYSLDLDRFDSDI